MPGKENNNFFKTIEQARGRYHDGEALQTMIVNGSDVNRSSKRKAVFFDFSGGHFVTINSLPILSAMLQGFVQQKKEGVLRGNMIGLLSYDIRNPDMENIRILIANGADINRLNEFSNFTLVFRPSRSDSYQIRVGDIWFGKEDPLLYDRGYKLAKLLISNGAKNLNITVYPDSEKISFLMKVYTPLAITYQQDYEYRRNNTPKALNKDVWCKVIEFDPPQQLEFLDSFSLSADEIRQIKELIQVKIENMTPEQKLIEMAYVIRNNKPTEGICSVIFQNLLLAFEGNDIVANFNFEKFEDEFISLYKKRIDNKAATLSDPATLQRAAQWCRGIVSAKEDAMLTTQDLKYISSIILLCSCKDLKGAKEKFDAFSEKTANQWCLRPLSNIIGSISNRKRLSHRNIF